MKFKKNSPFLDEVTAHGELFKGPKEVFVCPECGSLIDKNSRNPAEDTSAQTEKLEKASSHSGADDAQPSKESS